MRAPASSISTFMPARASSIAAHPPHAPEPTTMASYVMGGSAFSTQPSAFGSQHSASGFRLPAALGSWNWELGTDIVQFRCGKLSFRPPAALGVGTFHLKVPWKLGVGRYHLKVPLGVGSWKLAVIT